MPWIIIAIIVSYLIGSIPTAYIFGRLLKGIDIRKFGSGNVGATNALRVLGKGPGITVLLLDMFKGFAAVAFLGNFLSSRIGYISGEALMIIVGIFCIVGHNWTVFLNFKGGKGIATSLGVLLALAVKISSLKIIFGLVIASWMVIFVFSRIVSLASIISFILFPVYMFLFKQPLVLVFVSILLCILVILRHRSNLVRILQGKESRLIFKKAK